MLKYCYAYQHLKDIPTVLTIHNAEYQGWMGWEKSVYIPAWDNWQGGMLQWDGAINPLASGIKCAWKVTTVSPTYLAEMRHEWPDGLEALLEYEKAVNASGILNGIRLSLEPSNGFLFAAIYSVPETVEEGKQKQ